MSKAKKDMDNWHHSPQSFESLQTADRPRAKQKDRGACDFKVDQEHGVIIVKWYDNKPVHLISSYSGVELRDKWNRWECGLKAKGGN